MDSAGRGILDLFIFPVYNPIILNFLPHGRQFNCGKEYGNAIYLQLRQFRRLQPRRLSDRRSGAAAGLYPAPSERAQAAQTHRDALYPDAHQPCRHGAGGAGVLLCGASGAESPCGGLLLLCVFAVRRVLCLRGADLRLSGDGGQRVLRLGVPSRFLW